MNKDMSVLRTASLIIFVGLIACCEGKFLGGSINWYLLGGKIRFTYRLTWEKGTGPCGSGCSQASVNTPGTLPGLLSFLSWTCTSGCSGHTKLHDVNYVTTSVGSGASSWEQGEGSFIFAPPIANGKYEITLGLLRWSTEANGPGQLRTTVDLRIRSDTKAPNASPIAAVQPTIGVPSGCEKTIALPVIDPDADVIKCSPAGPADCGVACTTLTGIHIDNDKCTVTIPSTLKSGEYRLTVVVEDFPRSIIQVGGATSNLNQPLSTVPLQLTVHVIHSSGGCGPVIPVSTDTGPTVVYPPSGPHTGNLHAVQISAASHAEAIVSTSAGVITSQSPDTSHPGDIRVGTSWTPTPDQNGPALTCVWGLQHNGITSHQHCYTTNVRDQDDCSGGSKCLHGGTCIDLYKRFTCKCLDGWTSNDCSVRASCASSNPCMNGGTCEVRQGTISCICSQGYTGPKCEHKVDNCTSSPCLHGGTCTDKATGSSCTCTAQYTGSHCQTRSTHNRLQSTGSSVTASLLYVATISSGSQGVQVLDIVKVSDHSKENINVVVNNDSPPLWPIGVASGGLLLTALAGCGVWWCCITKPRGQSKGAIEPAAQVARRSADVPNHSPKSPASENHPRKSGNNVTQVETNTGTQVSGGSPRILNIYQSSANDPHLHKCGTKSRGNVQYNNTFW